MAISPQVFPPRKRRPSAGSFIFPNITGRGLVQSILLLSHEISDLKPIEFLLKRASSSIVRKSKLLAIIFEEILRSPVSSLPHSAVLCFEELYVVLQRVKTLTEDCSSGSKMWLLMQNESVANSFHELTVDLSTLLDICPLQEFDLSNDVKEVVVLLRKQCRGAKALVDPSDENLKREVLKLLDQIEREIVPHHSKLAEIFGRLGLRDSSSCRDEIECLEDEVQSHAHANEKSTIQMVALMGLVRFGKCVLFGASTPRSDETYYHPATELTMPVDFRCPISLELMRDPVVVATGQTYDRASISLWIDSGHNTCPKTGQNLADMNLIPNRALKNLIVLWCRQHKLPFKIAETGDKTSSVAVNKAALEATRMTALFLVNKLSVSPSKETANPIVHELRTLAKTDSDSRACIAEAGAIPLLVRHLGSDDPNLQVNAVTTLLNLSILDSNKTRIMETNGVLDGVVEVLRSAATWEAKGNAAAMVFSLSAVHAYRRKLGRKTRIVKVLVELARTGPTSPKRDALTAILNLAAERDCIGRLIEGGAAAAAVEVMDELPEETVAVLAAVARRGGAVAVAATDGAIQKLAVVLRDGPEGAKESAAAALVSVCRNNGQEVVALLTAIPGFQNAIWRLMGMGTTRAKRKSATLLRNLRRWAAAMDHDPTAGISTNITDVLIY